MKIHHNTFMHRPSGFCISAASRGKRRFHHNWVYRNYDEAKKKTLVESDGRTKAHDNVYGNPPRETVETYTFEKMK